MFLVMFQTNSTLTIISLMNPWPKS